MKDTITMPIAFIDRQIKVAEHNWNVAYGRDKDYYKGVKDTPEELKRLFAEESKMEKTYEKALDNLGDIKIVSGYDEETGEDEYTYVSCSFKYGEDLAILKKAIEKANQYDELMKPKKVLNITDQGYHGKYGFCGKCSTGIVQPLLEHIHHCPLCGQALDWEKEGK